ncbi:MAG: hypothetical protein ACJ8AI_25180 [Rhodopila sp.]
MSVPIALDLDAVTVSGSAITPAFLRDGLVPVLQRMAAMPVPGAVDPVALAALRPKPVAAALGYSEVRQQEPVTTREGAEDGGWLMQGRGGAALRLWVARRGADLDAGARRSPMRSAQRVLLVRNERAGLITNGQTLRLLLSDASRPDSFMAFPVDRWRDPGAVPDEACVLAGLAGAQALAHLPDVLQAAASHQAKVTAELRRQAREAILGFVNALPTP